MPTPNDTSVVTTHPIEFPAVSGESVAVGQAPLARFYDMTVVVTVQLGRVQRPIGELLRLGEGSILELEREVDEPVEILAQGMPLGRGEVVAVNGRYAVRITEIVAAEETPLTSPRPAGASLAAQSRTAGVKS